MNPDPNTDPNTNPTTDPNAAPAPSPTPTPDQTASVETPQSVATPIIEQPTPQPVTDPNAAPAASVDGMVSTQAETTMPATPVPSPDQAAGPTPVSPTVPNPANGATTPHGDGLGVASIILAFFAPLIGLILGIIGKNKGKKEGYDAKLSRIGFTLSLIFLILGTIIAILYIFIIAAAVSTTSTT